MMRTSKDGAVMAQYEGLAGVYDRLMSEVPYGDWADLVTQLIARYGISERNVQGSAEEGDTEALLAQERNLVVELGCGTGIFTGLLAERGFDVMGIDRSPDMLAAAQGKNAAKGYQIPYLCQDMRSLDLYCTAGTFLSICDSVNYLTTYRDLQKCFAGVCKFMYPGGVFIFDFHTKHYYRDVLGTRVITETDEDLCYIWDNIWDERGSINRYELTVFAEGPDGAYERLDETHVQRGYTLSEIKKLLSRAGLTCLCALDGKTRKGAHSKSERIFVAAGRL